MQKNKNKLIKSNKAITLIALVVTIVILIILAAVRMTMVLGNNGIFEQAKKGANSMASAEANTQEGFNSMSSEIDKIINGGEVKPEGMTVVKMFEKAQTDGCDGTKWRVLGVEEKNGKKHLLLLRSQIKKIQ